MQKVYKFLLLAFISNLIGLAAFSQDVKDTSITSIESDLINLFNQKTPKKYKVVSIKVTGNHYFDENVLISIANISVGDEILIPGGDAFAKAINKLWQQSYFSDIEIYITKLEDKNISLEIAVTERPRLSKFFFKGMTKSQQDDLKGKTGLIPSHIVTENMIRTAKDAIIKYFADKGNQNCKVDAVSQPDSIMANSVALTFYVDKGEKVKVNDIRFAGISVDQDALRKQMKGTKELSRFTLYPSKDTTGGIIKPQIYSFSDYMNDHGYFTLSKTKKVLRPYVRMNMFANAKFNEKKYEEDREKIIDYYNTLGFRDAVIEDQKRYFIDAPKTKLNIDIQIKEGHKYYFGNISWRGNTKYADSVLSIVLGIKKGDIYNLQTLNKKLGKGGGPPEGGDISGLYMDYGYLFFRSDAVETAVYNDTIDFEIRLVEGPIAKWKNIKITGNDKTKEHVIRRELRTMPGEPFSRGDLVRSQRELGQLNYFNAEKIDPQVVPNPDDGTVDVTWHLEEKSSDQLELSAGWGGTIGLTGTLGVSFNNFSLGNLLKRGFKDGIPMGDGQKLSLRYQSNGKAFRSYNFSFTEPWLGGKKRNAFTFSIYDTKYANTNTLSYSNNGGDSYIRTTGTTVSIGKQLKWPDDYFSFSTGLTYMHYQLKNYYIDPLNLPGFNNGPSNNLSLKMALQRASAGPSPTFPTYGSNFLMSVQLTPPFSIMNPDIVNKANPYTWIEYYKVRFNGEWFIPIGQPHGEDHKQLVLKAAAKMGYLGKYNPKLEISPFERFQVGDAGLSNQYALLGFDIISQRGYPVYQTSNPKFNPEQTAVSSYFTMFNKYVLELRYPLSLSPSSTIYGLAFFEAANGWYSIQDYNPFKLRRSVGFGMRFYLPMFGLLGFDYGLGLDRYTTGSSLKDISRFTFMLGFEPE
jgi:outer membrane protein insertion porin family